MLVQSRRRSEFRSRRFSNTGEPGSTDGAKTFVASLTSNGRICHPEGHVRTRKNYVMFWVDVGTAAWQNSVSSILSANPDLFASGQLVVKQSGWWTLATHSPPIPDGMSIDISDEILRPLSTSIDSTRVVVNEPQKRKNELLQRLQSIDPEILKAALAQSKRSVASIQKRMKIDSATNAAGISTTMEEKPAVVTKKEVLSKKEATKKESTPRKEEASLKKDQRPSEEDEQLRRIESMPLPDDPAERVRLVRLRRRLLHHKAQRAAGRPIFDLKARLQQLNKRRSPFLFIGTHELDEYGIPLRDDDSDCDPAKLLESDVRLSHILDRFRFSEIQCCRSRPVCSVHRQSIVHIHHCVYGIRMVHGMLACTSIVTTGRVRRDSPFYVGYPEKHIP